jgi:hypothetical protein
MFRKHESVGLRRKGRALTVACVASALIGLACVILSIRGSYEATIAAMVAVFAALVSGSWAHWALKDADRLAREIGSGSFHART